jgi:hypothetical protein
MLIFYKSYPESIRIGVKLIFTNIFPKSISVTLQLNRWRPRSDLSEGLQPPSGFWQDSLNYRND